MHHESKAQISSMVQNGKSMPKSNYLQINQILDSSTGNENQEAVNGIKCTKAVHAHESDGISCKVIENEIKNRMSNW